MKTTTDPDNWRFYFTVTDLARFLGKSPVTIRGWERKGLIEIPRDSGGDRKLNVDDILRIAQVAQKLQRITFARHNMIVAAMVNIGLIEHYNSTRSL